MRPESPREAPGPTDVSSFWSSPVVISAALGVKIIIISLGHHGSAEAPVVGGDVSEGITAARGARPRRRRDRLHLRAASSGRPPKLVGSFDASVRWMGRTAVSTPATQRPGGDRGAVVRALRPRQTRGRASRAAPRPPRHPAPQILRRFAPRSRPDLARPPSTKSH